MNKRAVALESRGDGHAPVISASGTGYAAEKILDIAFAEGVKVRKDKGLTDILAAFEVESPVPLEALGAVSVILDYVYRANQVRERQATGTPGRPVDNPVDAGQNDPAPSLEDFVSDY